MPRLPVSLRAIDIQNGVIVTLKKSEDRTYHKVFESNSTAIRRYEKIKTKANQYAYICSVTLTVANRWRGRGFVP